jgi:hypothetical protein
VILINDAFVISLSTRPYPSKLIQDLTQLSLNVHVVRAHEPMDPLESKLIYVDKDLMCIRLGYQPRMEQICCALSHRSVYEHISTLEGNCFLIFEDDVEIDQSRMRELLNLPILTYKGSFVIQLFSRGSRFVNMVLKNGNTMFGFFRYPPGQTCAYVISKKAALQALKSPIDGPADWPSWSRNVAFIGIYPWVATEGLMDSSIGPLPQGFSNFDRFKKFLQYGRRKSYPFGMLFDLLLMWVDSFVLWRLRFSHSQSASFWQSHIPRFFGPFESRKSFRDLQHVLQIELGYKRILYFGSNNTN